MFPFKIELLPNWKEVATKSYTMKLIGAGIVGELALEVFGVDLPLWVMIPLLGVIALGRILQQNIGNEKKDEETTDEPIGI